MKLTRLFSTLILICSGICSVLAEAPKTAKIVFTAAGEVNREIYLMNPDGSGRVNITNHPADDLHPTWSPTGEQILFVSDRVRIRDLYLMDADGSNVRRVFKRVVHRDNATWSPDGKQIAYVRDRFTDDEGIYIATIDGENEERIASGYSPAWSPDGTEIAFDTGGPGVSRIALLNLDTRTEKIILPVGLAFQQWADWSAEGDKIAFSWITAPQPVPPGVLPGERFLIPDEWFHNKTIFIMNRDGTGLEQIVDEAGLAAYWPAWSPRGDELIYTQEIDNQLQLFKIDLESRMPRQLTHNGLAFQANTLADWFDPAYALPVSPQPELLTTVWGKVKQR